MSSIIYSTRLIKDGDLPQHLPMTVNRTLDRLSPSLKLFVSLTAVFSASFVIHYVGFGWIGRIPDYMKQAWKHIKTSAQNLALERVVEKIDEEEDKKIIE